MTPSVPLHAPAMAGEGFAVPALQVCADRSSKWRWEIRARCGHHHEGIGKLLRNSSSQKTPENQESNHCKEEQTQQWKELH